MPAQWGISESHRLNEACEVFDIMRHQLTSFRSPSLFWPALLRHFLCLPVCSFHLFSLVCWLYGFTQDCPCGLWASARVTGLNVTKHSLCPAAGTLCVPLVLCVSEHLAVVSFPDFRLAARYLLSYTALAPLWRAELCLQRPLPRFLQSCRTVLCLRGSPFAVLILVFTHQEAEDCSGLEAKESRASWLMVTVPQRRSQEEGILTDDALTWI